MARRAKKQRGRFRRHSKATVNTGAVSTLMKTSARVNWAYVERPNTGNSLFRTRDGSININHHQTEEFFRYMETIYPTYRYSKRELKERGMPDEYGIITNNPVPRGEALRLIDEMLKETDITLRYRAFDGGERTVDFFFNAKKDKWYALVVDRSVRRIKKSGTYPSKEVLTAMIRSPKTILWVAQATYGEDDMS